VKLILTHDNADFDALASLFAAWKLDPAAVPVLPRRVNRNVEQFLNLYNAAFPFRLPDDLKRGGQVDSVTVVDTQSFTTVRGMRPDTPVHFIDHHPLDRELSAEQTYSGEPVGAATTLLVEDIHRRHITLEPLEATLLMLGIYEDTGSLSYGTTTARDIRCAAWLLECGADLDVVREFLQHRLLPEQRALYERLLEATETHTVNGHAVLLATASAGEPVDEIATLAHKLRELYEPSAVFVLVQLGSDIQLVARGATDAIDVAQVARRFGGGGHGRAAAALIRDRRVPAVRQQILDMLPAVTSASVRVQALMSVGVQTVRADDRVRTVHERMARTGHEGYPVVDADNRPVGLVTRRAVDRAMHHGLGPSPVRQVMDTGAITVRPSDSIDVLQQRMMRSGWGQIPVIDDEGRLLGIVTRTDLINQWGQTEDETRREAIVTRLRRTLAPATWRLLEAIAQQAQAQQVGLYLVGGFVRDVLLDIPNKDIDLVVEGEALTLVNGLQAAYGGDVRSHAQFGTAKWLLDADVLSALKLDADTGAMPHAIDFVSARREFYEEPTALPTVQRSSIKLDLYRRDFTINTLAIRLAPGPPGDVLDFYGGQQDLKDGVIRVLHSLSFVDDPTRMLRAVRLEQRLSFRIEERTEELIQSALSLLDRVSGDRIRHEFAAILAETEPLRALSRLERLGILQQIHPALRVDDWVRGAFYALRYARENHPWPSLAEFDNWMLSTFALLTSRLPADELERLGRRLQFSRVYLNHLQDARAAIARLPRLDGPLPASEVVAILEPVSEVGWLVGWAAAPGAQVRANIERFARQWRFVKPTFDGRALGEITGLKPGPLYGRLLGELRRAWLDGTIATPEQERALLARLVAQFAQEPEPRGD
jgi:tRNA nucleotidyltransferase (CCA-adding enzyme)